MNYTRQDFVEGQRLTHNHLNHIENGIIAAGNVRNLLDNSDFRNPINQRGQSSYSGAVYGIDRWRSWKDGSAIAIGDGYITLSGDVHHAQYIDHGVFVSGKSYTFACMKTDGTITAVSVTYPMSEERLVDEECAVFLREGELSYVVIYGAGDYVWAALYEGAYTEDTLPPYVPKGYAAELAECQRYYKSFGTTTLNGWYNNGGTTAVFSVNNSDMRIDPTVTCSVNSAKCNGYNIAGSSLTNPTATAMELKFSMSSGSTYSMHAVSVRFDSLVFNADL